jgi:hypothetical protein
MNDPKNFPQLTKEEQEVALHFNESQLRSLTTVCDLLLKITDPRTHVTVRKLYYNSLICAFQAGRVAGMEEMVPRL